MIKTKFTRDFSGHDRSVIDICSVLGYEGNAFLDFLNNINEYDATNSTNENDKTNSTNENNKTNSANENDKTNSANLSRLTANENNDIKN